MRDPQTHTHREKNHLLLRHRKPPNIETVYAEYGDRIYRFCYRLCGHAGEAEDLAQDVFVAAFQGLHGFQGRSSLTTWLYRIAFYRWRQLHPKGRAIAVALDDTLPEMPQEPDPALAGMQRMALEQALAALSTDLREAFLLVKSEGLTYHEAAEVLDTPQGTIQYRVHEAVKRLRVLLNETATTAIQEEHTGKEWAAHAM